MPINLAKDNDNSQCEQIYILDNDKQKYLHSFQVKICNPRSQIKSDHAVSCDIIIVLTRFSHTLVVRSWFFSSQQKQDLAKHQLDLEHLPLMSINSMQQTAEQFVLLRQPELVIDSSQRKEKNISIAFLYYLVKKDVQWHLQVISQTL